jgi:hypothetical protein
MDFYERASLFLVPLYSPFVPEFAFVRLHLHFCWDSFWNPISYVFEYISQWLTRLIMLRIIFTVIPFFFKTNPSLSSTLFIQCMFGNYLTSIWNPYLFCCDYVEQSPGSSASMTCILPFRPLCYCFFLSHLRIFGVICPSWLYLTTCLLRYFLRSPID